MILALETRNNMETKLVRIEYQRLVTYSSSIKLTDDQISRFKNVEGETLTESNPYYHMIDSIGGYTELDAGPIDLINVEEL